MPELSVNSKMVCNFFSYCSSEVKCGNKTSGTWKSAMSWRCVAKCCAKIGHEIFSQMRYDLVLFEISQESRVTQTNFGSRDPEGAGSNSQVFEFRDWFRVVQCQKRFFWWFCNGNTTKRWSVAFLRLMSSSCLYLTLWSTANDRRE